MVSEAAVTDAVTDASGIDAVDAAPTECRLDLVLEHSCLHVQHGPFASVMAGNSGTIANVSTPHTAFTVQLLEQPTNHVSYRPNQSGEHAFYLGPDVDLSISDDSAILQPKYREPVTTCAGIATVLVFDLRAQAKYTLGFERSALSPTTTLVIENVAALAARGWAERWEACQ
jgi:hypothetical protein